MRWTRPKEPKNLGCSEPSETLLWPGSSETDPCWTEAQTKKGSMSGSFHVSAGKAQKIRTQASEEFRSWPEAGMEVDDHQKQRGLSRYQSLLCGWR